MNLTQVINDKRVAIANHEIKKNYCGKRQREEILPNFLKEIGFEKEQSNSYKDVAGHFRDVYGHSSMSQVKIVEKGGPDESGEDITKVLICKKQDDGLVPMGEELYNVREDSDAGYTDTGFLFNDEHGELIDLTYEEGFNLILEKIREAWKLNTKEQ